MKNSNKKKKQKEYIFACDFETTVFEGQESTTVWAAAYVGINHDFKAQVFNNLPDFISKFESFADTLQQSAKVVLYFHNLKFDGTFILDYIINEGYTRAELNFDAGDTSKHEYIEDLADMPNKSFKTLISDQGLWYTITLKTEGGGIIEIRDSLKLLPFSIDKIAKDFKTTHQKLKIDYCKHTAPGEVITPEEEEYILADVYILKEGLQQMFKEGLKSLTIGSCCMKEFKKLIQGHPVGLNKNKMQVEIYEPEDFDRYFPDLTTVEIDPEIYGDDNADAYIRRAYKGGWCYLKKDRADKIIKNGLTLDVNSLYPSRMHSDGGTYYPIGYPHFWNGNKIPPEAKANHNYYFIKIRCSFDIRPGFLPFVQIKQNIRYIPTECLTSTNLLGKKYVETKNGIERITVDLTLTMTDFELLKNHYFVEYKILSGCWFYSNIGIFDDYINKWIKIKAESKGAKRTIAKLMLNNLYGKFATSNISSYKVPILDSDGVVKYFTVDKRDKESGYIAIGAAVTSYSRAFTITAAQNNYKYFNYSDTDSIHVNCDIKDVKGVKIHDSNLNAWKIENKWDVAFFHRQKTYIEIDGDIQYLKCAGMPERCKLLFLKSCGFDKNIENLTDEENEFLKEKHEITDLQKGLKVPGKLRPVRMPGGVVLKPTPFEVLF